MVAWKTLPKVPRPISFPFCHWPLTESILSVAWWVVLDWCSTDNCAVGEALGGRGKGCASTWLFSGLTLDNNLLFWDPSSILGLKWRVRLSGHWIGEWSRLCTLLADNILNLSLTSKEKVKVGSKKSLLFDLYGLVSGLVTTLVGALLGLAQTPKCKWGLPSES